VLLYWMVFGKAPYTYKNLMNPDDYELANQIKAGKASYNVASKNSIYITRPRYENLPLTLKIALRHARIRHKETTLLLIDL
jgi:hypothetical protein